MAQTDPECRVYFLLNRIARAQVIIAASVDELQISLRGLTDNVPVDRLVNFLGSRAAAHTSVANSPIVDMNAMTITWNGRTCRVHQVLLLRLFERLSRRFDQYVPIDRLLRDVWDGHVRTDDTVRSTVRHLKRRLAAAEMSELATAIKASGRRYGLILNHFG